MALFYLDLSYLVLCFFILIAMVDVIGRNWPRWTVADMLKLMLLLGDMLAVGRLLVLN